MNLFQLFFGFQGRINRARFWIALGILVFVGLILALLQYSLAISVGDTVAGIFGYAVSSVMHFSSYAIGAKRFHDRDNSGWLQLIAIAPLLILVPALLIQNSLLLLVTFAFGMTVAIWLFVELGCLKGTTGSNRFGPDPLEPEAKPSI